jgi:hypothetical protein
MFRQKNFWLPTWDFYVKEKTPRPLPPQAVYRDLLENDFLKKKKNQRLDVVWKKGGPGKFGKFGPFFWTPPATSAKKKRPGKISGKIPGSGKKMSKKCQKNDKKLHKKNTRFAL